MADAPLDPERFGSLLFEIGFTGDSTDVDGLYRRYLESRKGGKTRSTEDWLSIEGRLTEVERTRLLAVLEKEADPALLVGQVVDGYRIEGVLAAGGMGVVYRVHDPRLEKDFALKIVSPRAAGHPRFLARFHQEARLAAKIDDPHVVPILRSGEDSGRAYCLMPLVEGVDLERWVAECGALHPTLALEFLSGAARGLAAAHEAGVVHRDVKPGNLIADRKAGIVRVADFGLARDVDRELGLTLDGSFLGTPRYVAPEQALGDRVDARTDIYALGLVFYFLLTGRDAYDGSSQVEIVRKRLATAVPDPRAVNPNIPAPAVTLLRRMTATSPEERPASMREVLYAIASLQARSDRPRYRWAIPGLASFVVLAVVLTVILTIVLDRKARPTPDGPDEPETVELILDPFESDALREMALEVELYETVIEKGRFVARRTGGTRGEPARGFVRIADLWRDPIEVEFAGTLSATADFSAGIVFLHERETGESRVAGVYREASASGLFLGRYDWRTENVSEAVESEIELPREIDFVLRVTRAAGRNEVQLTRPTVGSLVLEDPGPDQGEIGFAFEGVDEIRVDRLRVRGRAGPDSR